VELAFRGLADLRISSRRSARHLAAIVRIRGVDLEVTRLGLDLDLTLIDTRDAVRHTLRELNGHFDNRIDVEALVGRSVSR
jgi:hypothetical protein